MNKLNALISELRHIECRPLFKTLKDYPYALIKGEALSYQINKRTGMRNSGDIDILITRKYLPNLRDCLRENGFTPIAKSRKEELIALTYSHQSMPWIKKTPLAGSIIVDVNVDLFWGEYDGERINIGEFLEDSQIINIFGADIKILTLEKSIIQIALHQYKDMNSIFLLATRKRYDLQAFFCIKDLICNNIEIISLTKLRELCNQYNITKYMYYVLFYTALITKETKINMLLDYFYDKDGETLLEYYGLEVNERKKWRIDFYDRISSLNLYDEIKRDLTDKDIKKIEFNSKYF